MWLAARSRSLALVTTKQPCADQHGCSSVLASIVAAPSCVRAKPGKSLSRPPAQLTPWPGQGVQAVTPAPPSLYVSEGQAAHV